MAITIQFKRYAVRVGMARPEIEPEEARPDDSPVKKFWDEFIREGAKLHAPALGPTAMDMGIAANLLRKHDHQRLVECARLFWVGQWSRPFFENPSVRPMRLFAANLTEIEREL